MDVCIKPSGGYKFSVEVDFTISSVNEFKLYPRVIKAH